MIKIVTGDSRPIFRQIVDGIALKIAYGDLVPGSRLPSVRGLAMELTINPNTVARAYTELISEGLIESIRGVGVFVCEPRNRFSLAERKRRLDDAIQKFLGAVAPLGFSPKHIQEDLERELKTFSSTPETKEVLEDDKLL